MKGQITVNTKFWPLTSKVEKKSVTDNMAKLMVEVILVRASVGGGKILFCLRFPFDIFKSTDYISHSLLGLVSVKESAQNAISNSLYKENHKFFE